MGTVVIYTRINDTISTSGMWEDFSNNYKGDNVNSRIKLK